MSFMRGMFDTADLSGHRITYLGCIEVALNLGAMLSAIGILSFILIMGAVPGMKSFYFLVAAVSLLIMTPKFHLYRK